MVLFIFFSNALNSFYEKVSVLLQRTMQRRNCIKPIILRYCHLNGCLCHCRQATTYLGRVKSFTRTLINVIYSVQVTNVNARVVFPDEQLQTSINGERTSQPKCLEIQIMCTQSSRSFRIYACKDQIPYIRMRHADTTTICVKRHAS